MTLADGSALLEGLSINETSGEINWATPVQGKYNLKITATRGEESTSKVLKLIIEPEDGCTHEGAKIWTFINSSFSANAIGHGTQDRDFIKNTEE